MSEDSAAPDVGAAVEVTKAYTAHYADPISFNAGEDVCVGRGDPEYPGWYWCRAASGKEGWVHRSFLAGCEGITQSRDVYTAQELTAAVGERGHVLRSLAGWVYVRLARGDEGWLPASRVTAAAR